MGGFARILTEARNPPVMQPLTILFLILLAITVATRLWLAARQARAVASHADQVPAPFADSITLEEHRKAAAYTADRLRFGRLHLIFDSAILVLVTVGGSYSALASAIGRLGLPMLWSGVNCVEL